MESRKEMEEIFKRFAGEVDNVWHLFLNMNDGLLITDHHERILLANPAFERISGYSYKELIGRTPRIVKSGLTPKSQYKEMRRALNANSTWTGDMINRRKDGELYYADQTITAVHHGDQVYYTSITRDVTEQVNQQKEVHQLAYYDRLTGLPNQAYLYDVLTSAACVGEPFAVALFDIDRFKYINDVLGHHNGDKIICEVAKRLEQYLPDKSVVSRFSGDAFLVYLTGFDNAETIVKQIEVLMHHVRKYPFIVGSERYYLTLSGGISVYPHDGTEIDALIKYADQAMYRSKDNGRNTYQFYLEGMEPNASNRLELMHELNQAVKKNQFVVYFQPQICLADHRVIGVEALVRWNHPTRGLLTPYHFLNEAEEFGLLSQIDQLVMAEAFATGRHWHASGYDDLVISVNMSQHLFNQANVVEVIKTMLKTSGIKPKNVLIEITENVALSQVAHAKKIIDDFHAIGVKVALDDFGTGYSSLSQLRNFPFDSVKIDQSFIRSSTGDDLDAAFVESIIHMAKLFHFDVVTEGIETQSQLAFVKEKHADIAQGYLIQKPAPKDKVRLVLLDDLHGDSPAT